MDKPTADTPRRPQKKHHLWAWLITLIVIAALALPLFLKSTTATTPGGGRGGPGGPGGVVSVTSSPVRIADMSVFIDALGTVTPVATVNVYSQISGQVMAVKYAEGQIVQQGDVLAEIDDRPTKAQLEQARGALARDQATLEQAKTNLKRYQSAFEEKAVSEQTVADEQAAVNQTLGTVANDEANVRFYQVQLDYCTIKAPITGRVGLRLVDAGNTIFSGSSTVVTTITQLQPITAVFSVAEDHLPKLQSQASVGGTRAVVELFDRTHTAKLATGTLAAVDNQVDTSTGTVRLRADFPNTDNALFPNQFVNARLEVDTLKGVTLVPTIAVQFNSTQGFVFVVGADGKAVMRNVTVLNTENEQSAVEGVKAGETVITSNFDRLIDGAAVTLASATSRPTTGHAGASTMHAGHAR